MGHVCHLRPSDLGDLTAAQLKDCFYAIKVYNGDIKQ